MLDTLALADTYISIADNGDIWIVVTFTTEVDTDYVELFGDNAILMDVTVSLIFIV